MNLKVNVNANIIKNHFENICKNWYFPFSFLFFIIANIKYVSSKGDIITIILSGICAIILSSWWKNLKGNIYLLNKGISIFSVISAFGFCTVHIGTLVTRIDKFILLISSGLIVVGNGNIVTFLAYLLEMPAVYILISLILKEIQPTIYKIIHELDKTERIIIGIVFAFYLIYSWILFNGTSAFYQPGFYNIIYTSDSGILTGSPNCYLDLFHFQNDLRQPLFAVFSAPFMGAFYLIARIFCFHIVLFYYLQNVGQIILLFSANIMLSALATENKKRRIAFFVAFSLTYTMLLFSVMMEQYIVGYFWLIVFIYKLIKEKKIDYLSFIAMSGCLLTNLIWTPFLAFSGIREKKKINVTKAVKGIAVFVFTMFLFMRFDDIFHFWEKLESFNEYSTGVSYKEKVLQFISFIRNCFMAPFASEIDGAWELNPVTSINFVGCIILLIALLGFWVSRHDILSKISFGWIVFSYIILVQFGWGTAENGLVLYSLYFAWAYTILAFRFFDCISRKIKSKYLFYMIALMGMIYIANINFDGISKIVETLQDDFPV